MTILNQWMISRITTFLVIFTLTGCQTTPKQHFAKSSEVLKDGSNVELNIYLDCMVFEDPVGSDFYIDLNGNLSLCNEFQRQAQQRLVEFGLKKITVKQLSIGSQAGEYTYVYDAKRSKVYLPHLPDAKNNSSHSVMLLSEAIGRARGQGSYGRSQFIKAVSKSDYSLPMINDMKNNEYTLLILSRGVRVPVGQSIAQGVATAVLTLGMATYYEHSIFTSKIAIIDNTGKTIWADTTDKSLSSGDGLSQSVGLVLKKLFSEFPRLKS